MADFLGDGFGIIILLVAAGWFIGVFPGTFFTLMLVELGLFAAFLIKESWADKSWRANEAARQRAYGAQIVSACRASSAALATATKDLASAELVLDSAESQFRDRMSAPFWDSIERALRRLGAVDDGITLIVDRFNQYAALAASYYEGEPPAFPVDAASARQLQSAGAAAARLQAIAHQAQREPRFAAGYDERKSGEILMPGFATLGDAIQGLGARLAESIGLLGDLASPLQSMHELVSAVEDAAAAAGAGTRAQTAITDRTARQDDAGKLPDNIRRLPTPFNSR